MRTKANASTRIPIRRGLGASEAAIYLSLPASFFRDLVRRGVMPPPRLIGKRRVWDFEELDVAFRALPHETSDLAPDRNGFGAGS